MPMENGLLSAEAASATEATSPIQKAELAQVNCYSPSVNTKSISLHCNIFHCDAIAGDDGLTSCDCASASIAFNFSSLMY